MAHPQLVVQTNSILLLIFTSIFYTLTLLFLFLLVMASLAHSAGLFFWCTLKYTPQALHTGEPMLSFLHVEVVVVKQLEQLSKGVMEKFGVE